MKAAEVERLVMFWGKCGARYLTRGDAKRYVGAVLSDRMYADARDDLTSLLLVLLFRAYSPL